MGNAGQRCCIDPCRTLYKLDSAFEIEWVTDFYEQYVNHTNPTFQRVYQCDVDAEGNVYQVGSHTGELANNTFSPGDPAPPQVDDMWTVRSWDSAGGDRWDWSDDPDGTVTIVSTVSRRRPPLAQLSCRIAPNVTPDPATDEMLLVGDTGTSKNVNLGYATAQGTTATALDTDGNVLWSVSLGNYQAVCHSVGATRSLWRVTAEIVGDNLVSSARTHRWWLLLDNADGTIVYDSKLGVSGKRWSLGNMPSTTFVGRSIAAIGPDDLVYEVQSAQPVCLFYSPGRPLIPGQGAAGVTVITCYSDDGATVDWSVCSPYMFGGVLGSCCGVGTIAGASQDALGPAMYTGGTSATDLLRHGDIIVEDTSIVVSTAFGFERFDITDGAHIMLAGCSPANVIYYSTADVLAVYATTTNGTPVGAQRRNALYTPDGDRDQIWNGGTVKDARKTPDGGSLWSLERKCTEFTTIVDPRDPVAVCTGSRTWQAVDVSEWGYENTGDGIGLTDWEQSAEECGDGCGSLRKDQPPGLTEIHYATVGYLSNAYLAIDSVTPGSQAFAGFITGDVVSNVTAYANAANGLPAVPAAASIGDEVSFDCYCGGGASDVITICSDSAILLLTINGGDTVHGLTLFTCGSLGGNSWRAEETVLGTDIVVLIDCTDGVYSVSIDDGSCVYAGTGGSIGSPMTLTTASGVCTPSTLSVTITD